MGTPGESLRPSVPFTSTLLARMRQRPARLAALVALAVLLAGAAAALFVWLW
jgi:hypothetical protein